MQDIHSIGLGGGGGGDRRLRSIAGAALSHHLTGGGLHALKCPRCDSLNTKFCYYNNYNLSQPRHFCKSCRRYWTKGGVLRNVPVGGGCRKSKSKNSSKPSTDKQIAAAVPPPPPDTPASNSHSSSESSGLSATNAAGTVDAVSGFNSLVFEGGPPMFPDLGGLSGLMTSPSSESALTSFDFSNNSLLLGHSQEQLQQVSAAGGFGPLDWQGTGGGAPADQVLFDLPVINTVDQTYWSQSQWNIGDHDQPNLYIP